MLNNISLMGRLTAEPELKHAGENAVISFTLAVGRPYVKKGAERITDFIDCVAWRNTAEFISRYFHKGSMIALEGRLQTRSFEDKSGNKRKAVEVLANQVYFAEASKEAQKPAQATAPAQDEFKEISDDSDLPF